MFSTTWPASFSGSFPVRFLGQSFVFNNFGSFVSASFPVRFFGLSFVFNNFPGSFFKKRISFFCFWRAKRPGKVILQGFLRRAVAYPWHRHSSRPSSGPRVACIAPQRSLFHRCGFSLPATQSRPAGRGATKEPATQKQVPCLPAIVALPKPDGRAPLVGTLGRVQDPPRPTRYGQWPHRRQG